MATSIGCTTRTFLLALLVGLPSRWHAHSVPHRALQAGCPCEYCVVQMHNAQSVCESLGMDCSCFAGAGQGWCDLDERTAEVNAECCDEPSEDCSAGRPATCNSGCADVLLPYYEDCTGSLGPAGAKQLDDVVELCQAAEGTAPPVGPPGGVAPSPPAAGVLPLPDGFEEVYDVSGCSNPAHCGRFRRVLARCTTGDGCPGGQHARPELTGASSQLCDNAPVYQAGDANGPVLYRFYGWGTGTQWRVGSSDRLADCFAEDGHAYLQSGTQGGSEGFPPTAEGYLVDAGWIDRDDSCVSRCGISVVAGPPPPPPGGQH
jgi:hypothetical protein